MISIRKLLKKLQPEEEVNVPKEMVAFGSLDERREALEFYARQLLARHSNTDGYRRLATLGEALNRRIVPNLFLGEEPTEKKCLRWLYLLGKAHFVSADTGNWKHLDDDEEMRQAVEKINALVNDAFDSICRLAGFDAEIVTRLRSRPKIGITLAPAPKKGEAVVENEEKCAVEQCHQYDSSGHQLIFLYGRKYRMGTLKNVMQDDEHDSRTAAEAVRNKTGIRLCAAHRTLAEQAHAVAHLRWTLHLNVDSIYGLRDEPKFPEAVEPLPDDDEASRCLAEQMLDILCATTALGSRKRRMRRGQQLAPTKDKLSELAQKALASRGCGFSTVNSDGLATKESGKRRKRRAEQSE